MIIIKSLLALHMLCVYFDFENYIYCSRHANCRNQDIFKWKPKIEAHITYTNTHIHIQTESIIISLNIHVFPLKYRMLYHIRFILYLFYFRFFLSFFFVVSFSFMVCYAISDLENSIIFLSCLNRVINIQEKAQFTIANGKDYTNICAENRSLYWDERNLLWIINYISEYLPMFSFV